MDSLEVESTPGKGTLVKMSKIIGKGRKIWTNTIDLIQKSHEGDEEARARLVEENAGLVWCIVKRFHNRGVENGRFISDWKYRSD